MKRFVSREKKLNLRLAIQICIITTLIATIVSTAKFRASVSGKSDAVVAIPILSSGTILLEDIYPQMPQIMYDLVVENSKGLRKTDVSMNYNIAIENVGNLPIKIEIYKVDNNSNIVGNNLLNDEGKTPAFLMPIVKSTHNYKLIISWDNANSQNNYIYSGETNYIKILIDAVQKD